MNVRHSITLNPHVSSELETLTRELGEKKSEIIEKALTLYFDMLDLRLAEKRMNDLKKGNDILLDADSVWDNLGV